MAALSHCVREQAATRRRRTQLQIRPSAPVDAQPHSKTQLRPETLRLASRCVPLEAHSIGSDERDK